VQFIEHKENHSQISFKREKNKTIEEELFIKFYFFI